MILKLFKKKQKTIIPKRLLASNVKVTKRAKNKVLKEIEIERNWYRNVPGFKSIQEMHEAETAGILSKVTGNENYLPIMRLRNPKLAFQYPPYLTTQCKAMLDEIGKLWREEMDKAAFEDTIRFAVTSLSRTLDYQKTIVKAGKLADPDSVHTRGEAFDLDASGYYIGNTPINARNGLQEGFANAFNDMNAKVDAPAFGDYALYEPKVHKLLKTVLEQMEKDGKLHFVHEFPNSKNDVFHVCRNPEYQPR